MKNKLTPIYLQRQSDGTLIDWGRNAVVNGNRGAGGARVYCGEALKVMNLILKHGREK